MNANYIKHGLISEQATPILTANICRNAAAIAYRLGGRITTGTPYRPQNVYRNGVPVRSGTTTPLAYSDQTSCTAFSVPVGTCK